MRKCFGVKSKKLKCERKDSALIKKSPVRPSKRISALRNHVPIRRIITSHRETIHNDNSIATSDAVHALNGFGEQLILKQNKESPPPVVPRSSSSFSGSTKNKFKNATEILSTSAAQDLPTKTKLPPISSSDNTQKETTPSTTSVLPTRHTPGLCGLNNFGNTCFMNSAIQCLSSIPILIDWIMQQRTSSICRNVIDAYISLVHAMWSGRNNCFTPRDLKTFVSGAAPLFADYSQQDSHEFMNSFLNAIENTDSNSFIVNIFRITTQSKITCQKHQHVDMITETTTFLSLPLPEIDSYNPASIPLEDLIQEFCQENDLNGTYYCHQCNDYTTARQRTTIISPLPRVLIIQLKRFPFDNSNKKIDTLVQYKFEYENLLSKGDRYKLSAISLHSGSLSGGHYTTIARNYRTQKWYRFDDSHVEEIDCRNIVVPFTARQAYILIYLKEDD